jgi:hypothetical protein
LRIASAGWLHGLLNVRAYLQALQVELQASRLTLAANARMLREQMVGVIMLQLTAPREVCMGGRQQCRAFAVCMILVRRSDMCGLPALHQAGDMSNVVPRDPKKPFFGHLVCGAALRHIGPRPGMIDPAMNLFHSMIGPIQFDMRQ